MKNYFSFNKTILKNSRCKIFQDVNLHSEIGFEWIISMFFYGIFILFFLLLLHSLFFVLQHHNKKRKKAYAFWLNLTQLHGRRIHMKFYKTHPNEFDDNKWLNKYISTSYEHKMIKMMEHILYKVCYYSTTKTKKK